MRYTVHWLWGDLKDMTLKCDFYSRLQPCINISPLVTHGVNSQPCAVTDTRFSGGALPPVTISPRKKKIQVIQKVKSSLREKWAPANSASCTSSYCRPYISISFVIALEALQLPIQKIQQCWGSHNLHFSHSTASLPRHARTSGQHICALMHSVTSAAAPAKAQTLLQAATSNPFFTWGNRKHYLTE